LAHVGTNKIPRTYNKGIQAHIAEMLENQTEAYGICFKNLKLVLTKIHIKAALPFTSRRSYL
jgi:hypothetical protein